MNEQQSPFQSKSTLTARSPDRSKPRTRSQTNSRPQTPPITLPKPNVPKIQTPLPSKLTESEPKTPPTVPKPITAPPPVPQTHQITTQKPQQIPTQIESQQNQTQIELEKPQQIPTEIEPEKPQQIPTQTENMDQQKIQQCIANFVPEFNGENTKNQAVNLTRFLDTADSIFETLNDVEKKIFDRLIKLRLTGEAYIRISHRNIKDYNQLKEVLTNMYTELHSLDELEKRFCSIQQSYGENIRSYGYRIIEALQQYKEGYKTKYNIANIDDTYTKHLDTTAIQLFKRGLNNTILREKIATIKTTNVDEIINETEEIEKMLNMSTGNTPNITKPTLIGETNLTQNVYRKPIVICNYCQKTNHTWDVCRTRMYNERANRTTQYQTHNTNFNTTRQPNIQYTQTQQPYYKVQNPGPPVRQQVPAAPQNYTNSQNYNQQQQRNQFTPAGQRPQYQMNQHRNYYTPKYCSHCKTTTGHTFEECRSKYFSRKPHNELNQNIDPAPPDANMLTESFNKMRINTIYPQQVHKDYIPTQQSQPENSQGSEQP